MFAFAHGGGARIRLGPERGGPEADPRQLANDRTLVFCAVLSLSSPLIPAAPLKKPPTSLRDGGGENKRMSRGRNVTNELQMPEFALSLIFRRESRRGWWPETRPQLALLLLYCRSCDGALAAPRHVGGAGTALNGAGFEPGPARLLEGGASVEMGRSVCFSGWAESRMQDAVTFLYFGF